MALSRANNFDQRKLVECSLSTFIIQELLHSDFCHLRWCFDCFRIISRIVHLVEANNQQHEIEKEEG